MATKRSVLHNSKAPTTKEKETYFLRRKLWICDCVRMPVNSEDEKTYIFKGMDIQLVDIVGVVIGVKKFRTLFTGYIVDDGTDAILVTFYHKKEAAIKKKTDIKSLRLQVAETRGFTSHEHKILDYMMGQVLRVHEEVLEDRKIGDTVHVVGQLCDFRNERQINASHFNVVDMNYETERIFEVIKVYDNYGKGIKK